MPILPALATRFQSLFAATDSGQERWRWFRPTRQAILVPIAAARTSNLLRAIATLFGVQIEQSRYYTFMASVKLRWERVWAVLWRAIPDPLTDGRLLLALDDAINPKTGRKVFGCQPTFDPKPVPVGADDRRGGPAEGGSTDAGAACPWPLPSICAGKPCRPDVFGCGARPWSFRASSPKQCA
jgi:hypothetical protein